MEHNRGMTPRHCTPSEAVSLLRPTDSVGLGLGPANPDGFLTALGERDDWESLSVGGALLLGYYTAPPTPSLLPLRVLRPGRAHPLRRGPRGRAGARRLPPVRPHPPAVLAPGHGGPGRPPGTRRHPQPVTALRGHPRRASGRRTRSRASAGDRDEPPVPPDHQPRPYDNTVPLDLVDVLVEADTEPYVLADAVPSAADEAIAAMPVRTSPKVPPCRPGSAASPPWWPPAWPRGPGAATASTARCSPMG